MVFRLPRLQKNLRLVDKDGTPALTFMRWFNMDFAGAIEDATQEIIEVNDVQTMLIEDLEQAQADIIAVNAAQDLLIAQLAAVVLQGQTVAMQAQQAQAAANTAQTTADEALANGTVSGSATDPSITTGLTGAWVQGPQVDLVGVVAGNLTITGTGPQQDEDVAFTIGTSFSGQYRVVEIDGMTETVLGTFGMSATGDGSSATITNNSVAAVEAFSMALTTTGNLSYRIDVQKTSGGDLNELLLYIFARRAA